MNAPTLKKIFWAAYENSHSSFYRSLYKEKGFEPSASFLDSLSDWYTLPPLTKQDLIDTPLYERVFTPLREVTTIRTTSGTTGGNVLLTPRNSTFDYANVLLYTNIRSVLSFMYPHHYSVRACEKAGITFIGGDPGELEMSAKLAEKHLPEGIVIIPPLLVALIPFLSTAVRERIKLLELYGDILTDEQQHMLKEHFPNAQILFEYGTAETHGVSALPCKEAFDAQEQLFHPLSDTYYWELLDPDSDKKAEVQGEIILTTLWEHNVFPALRYRTGDTAELVTDHSCSLTSPAYRITGRVISNRVKVAGGEINVHETERVLKELDSVSSTEFQLRVDKNAEHSSGIKIVLLIRPNTSDVSLGHVADFVEEKLRISPNVTLKSAKKRGLLPLLECALLPDRGPTEKLVRLVDNR